MSTICFRLCFAALRINHAGVVQCKLVVVSKYFLGSALHRVASTKNGEFSPPLEGLHFSRKICLKLVLEAVC